MKSIIKKWYDNLGFPKEWEKEFNELIENKKFSPCNIEEYNDAEDVARNLPMYLFFCEKLQKKYESVNIPEKILFDTLSDIVIWAKVHYDIHGTLGLSETKWLRRHLTMKLFKLGRLQFCMADGELEIHIPSGEAMFPEQCEASICQSKQFFKTYFPDFVYDKYTCHSWMLDDTLLNFLSEGSNIIKFMRMFEIKSREKSDAALKYIFRFDATRENVSTFPAESSLAKKIRQYVIDGGLLYEALGEIRLEKI